MMDISAIGPKELNSFVFLPQFLQRAGVIRRGIRSIRRSFRRSRTESTSKYMQKAP